MMEKYTCPMHPEVVSLQPGRCPKCGMKLVKKESNQAITETATKSYTPLVVIIGLTLLTAFTVALAESAGGFSLITFVMTFMTGFFLVFSGFKLMDLSGFAQGYSTYDLLARRVYGYGYIYPFVELFFGLAMIIGWEVHTILLAEIIVMTLSGLGVAIKLLKHQEFQCACLGTFLKVPLTQVTLVEDFGMAFLALLMLILR